MDANPNEKTHLTWINVALAFVFILFNITVSFVFGLDRDVPFSLLTAAVRCVVQLSILSLVLEVVFKGGPWAVAGLAIVLNLLGTIETGELTFA
jgi:ABC-type iron transport system FetAB permease component